MTKATKHAGDFPCATTLRRSDMHTAQGLAVVAGLA